MQTFFNILFFNILFFMFQKSQAISKL